MSLRPFLLLPVMQLLLWGQAAVGQVSTAQPPDGSIEGRVINAVTGEPVGKATITTVLSGGVNVTAASTRYVSTDASGRFVLRGLPAGRYALTAFKSGFVPMRTADSAIGYISVASGQEVTGMVLRISPCGVLTGRIVDEDGDPVVRASVRLSRDTVVMGKRRIQQISAESTNDLGEYRFFEITPGRYYVSASAQVRGGPAAGADQDYGLTYYPGVVTQASAQGIDVRAGDRTEGVNFALRKTRVVRVSGRITRLQEGSDVQLRLSPRGTTAAPPISSTRADRENGAFTFSGVAPGSYSVTATELQSETYRTVGVQIEVGASDVENLNIAFAPHINVNGRLRMEGSDRLPEQVPVSLAPRDSDKAGYEILQILRGSGGSFRVQNASPAAYIVQLNSRTMYVKKVRVGSTETASPILDLSSSAGVADVEILLSNNPPRVSGTVRNPKTGEPAAKATVVLIPNEPERKGDVFFYEQASADASGRFTFTAPPVAGSYTAYAWPDASTAAYMEPDFMKEFEGKGVELEVSEGRESDLKLSLLTADSNGQ
jgi:hypothetical protein